MFQYHCLNPIAGVGLNQFTSDYTAVDKAENVDAILVRSAAMHDMEFNKELKVIARAGAGVNNIPLDRCAEEGIVVFNTPGANANGVKEMVLAVAKEYNADESRIALTGISMGGYGSWDLMGKYPEMWYKAAPVCGGGDTALAPNMKHIPTRVYHGQKDEAVPFRESVEMVDAMKASGGNVEFFVYPEKGHNVWDTAYGETDLIEWLLA